VHNLRSLAVTKSEQWPTRPENLARKPCQVSAFLHLAQSGDSGLLHRLVRASPQAESSLLQFGLHHLIMRIWKRGGVLHHDSY